MNKAELASALASYLWPPEEPIPEGAWEILTGTEVYAFPLKTADPSIFPNAALRLNDRTIERVVEAAYDEALGVVATQFWPEVGWLGEPAIVRTPRFFTLVAAAEPPSFKKLETPVFLSELEVSSDEARRRLASARRILRAVRAFGASVEVDLASRAYWEREAPLHDRPRRQDWRPRQRRK